MAGMPPTLGTQMVASCPVRMHRAPDSAMAKQMSFFMVVLYCFSWNKNSISAWFLGNCGGNWGNGAASMTARCAERSRADPLHSRAARVGVLGQARTDQAIH